MNASTIIFGIFEQEIYEKLHALTCIEWHHKMLDVLCRLEHCYKSVQNVYIITTDNELSLSVICNILALPKIVKIFVLYNYHKKSFQSDQLNTVLSKPQVSFHSKQSFDLNVFKSLIDPCSIRSENVENEKFTRASSLKCFVDDISEEPSDINNCKLGLVDTFLCHSKQVYFLSEDIPNAKQNAPSNDSIVSNERSGIENIIKTIDESIDMMLCMPKDIRFSDEIEVEN